MTDKPAEETAVKTDLERLRAETVEGLRLLREHQAREQAAVKRWTLPTVTPQREEG